MQCQRRGRCRSSEALGGAFQFFNPFPRSSEVPECNELSFALEAAGSYWLSLCCSCLDSAQVRMLVQLSATPCLLLSFMCAPCFLQAVTPETGLAPYAVFASEPRSTLDEIDTECSLRGLIPLQAGVEGYLCLLEFLLIFCSLIVETL